MPLFPPRYADSLNQLLIKPGITDSLKAQTNLQLATYWIMQNDTAKAIKYLEIGRRQAVKNRYLSGVTAVTEGQYYYVSDTAKSFAAYTRADSILAHFDRKDVYTIRSKIWASLAALRQRKDDDEGYIKLVLNKAIPLAEKAGDSASIGYQYVGLGIAFMNIDQNDKAAHYLDKAIAMLKNGKDPYRLAGAYNRAAENYMLLKKLDKVEEMLNANRKLLAPYPESPLYAGFYMAEGMLFEAKKQYDDAIVSFEKGIAKASGPNRIYVIQELRFYKVRCLLAVHRYREAKHDLQLLALDKENMSLDQNRLEVFMRLAEAYAGLGQMDSAFHYQKQSTQLNDSLHLLDFKQDINDLEAKYQTAENQKQIARLQAEKAETALAASNSRLFSWILGVSAFLLLIVVVFSWIYYRNYKSLALQKEVNYRQQLKELEQQQQLVLTNAILAGEERERKRVARDLHDGLGGILAGIKINLSSWITRHSKTPQTGELHNVLTQLDDSVNELRRIARNMMPETLLKFGLETALRDLCEFHNTESLTVDFQSYDIDPAIPLSVQIQIYRMIQEMLSNAVRHAGAHHILLQCSQAGCNFFITVEDDGIGFELGKMSDKEGMGLKNLKSRVAYLKGKMEIHSSAKEGTSINIELDLNRSLLQEQALS
ncbi:ATP-binding protein [Olivibacter ginsenosidimutans]|uniref:histidine kinase n=2 Tax=Olivibacter ginsenosidimutans TaxID=1176537 RepID=A0ABP9BSL9_9SPHI